jgi:hypothetical protein
MNYRVDPRAEEETVQVLENNAFLSLAPILL